MVKKYCVRQTEEEQVEPPCSGSTMSVDSHLAKTVSIAAASARSMVRPYSRRTRMMRYTYQHSFRSGSHSGAC